MTDPLIDLLSYHNPLDDLEFKQQVLARIKATEQKRHFIMMLFTVIGLLLSVIYLWSVLPVGVAQNLLTPTNGLLLSSIGLFLVWLWSEELSQG